MPVIKKRNILLTNDKIFHKTDAFIKRCFNGSTESGYRQRNYTNSYFLLRIFSKLYCFSLIRQNEKISTLAIFYTLLCITYN